MSAPLDIVTAALEAKGCNGSGRDWQCPAHEDRRKSLSVTEGNDGLALLKCHAGCEFKDIVAALGLEMADLFPEREKPNKRSKGNGKRPRIVTTYPYTDEAGTLLYEVVRYEPKDFRQRRPDSTAKDGWAWNLNETRRVLYRLPEVVAAIQSNAVVYLTEGEKDADAIRALGLQATTHAGGAKNWKPSDYAESLRGARVVVLPDDDGPGRDHGRAVAASLSGIAAEVRILNLGRPGVKDPADWIAGGGTRSELEKLTAGAPTLAELSRVDGAALLNRIVRFLRRFVVVTLEQAVVIALWIVHTYAFEASDQTPYLAVVSAEKRSGKTRLLEVLGALAREAWHALQPSEAVLYRKIQRDHPALLLDETDALFSQKGNDRTEAVRALLNAGSRRGATVSRCAAHGDDLVDFEVFCPKVLAGIGSLPDTVGDRSFLIQMKRKRRTDSAERFRPRDVEEEAQKLRGELQAWADTHVEALRKARPDLPPTLGDRAADGAEPLLGIADLAGGRWPVRARVALVALAGETTNKEESDGTTLLFDIRRVLGVLGRTDGHVRTDVLLRQLLDLPESAWSRFGREKEPLGHNGLAKLLRPFGIRPGTFRDSGGTPRGYAVPEFLDAFDRYLDEPEKKDSPEESETVETPKQTAARAAKTVSPYPKRDPKQDPIPSPRSDDTGACPDPCPGPESSLCFGSCFTLPETNQPTAGAVCFGVSGVSDQAGVPRKRVAV